MAGIVPPFTEETARNKVLFNSHFPTGQLFAHLLDQGKSRSKSLEHSVCLFFPFLCLRPRCRILFYTILKTQHRDPVAVSKAYTPDSIWRNRDCFLQGTDAIITFLTNKWEKEQGYRLRKELFAWAGNKIAVQVCRSRHYSI